MSLAVWCTCIVYVRCTDSCKEKRCRRCKLSSHRVHKQPAERSSSCFEKSSHFNAAWQISRSIWIECCNILKISWLLAILTGDCREWADRQRMDRHWSVIRWFIVVRLICRFTTRRHSSWESWSRWIFKGEGAQSRLREEAGEAGEISHQFTRCIWTIVQRTQSRQREKKWQKLSISIDTSPGKMCIAGGVFRS